MYQAVGLQVSLNKTSATNFQGNAAVNNIGVQGTLQPEQGGTGQTILSAVTVGKANSLATAKSIVASLGSTVAASFNGSANVTVGTQGILPIAKGGTNASTADAARTNLGLGTAATTAASIYPSLAGTNTFSNVNTFASAINMQGALIVNSTISAHPSLRANINFATNYLNNTDSISPTSGIRYRVNSQYATGVYGMRPSSLNYANNLMVFSPHSMVLASGVRAGLNILRYSGTDSLRASGFGIEGRMHFMSQSGMEFLTNCEAESIRATDGTLKHYRFVFDADGYADFPELHLTKPLGIEYGGTGTTSVSDILNVMGLGNKTGVYTCNISTVTTTGATLTNDIDTSPMVGLNTLNDGTTVYFYKGTTTTVTSAAKINFNDVHIHTAYSISGGTATTVRASNLSVGYYRAVYHNTALGTAPAYTWLIEKIS